MVTDQQIIQYQTELRKLITQKKLFLLQLITDYTSDGHHVRLQLKLSTAGYPGLGTPQGVAWFLENYSQVVTINSEEVSK